MRLSNFLKLVFFAVEMTSLVEPPSELDSNYPFLLIKALIVNTEWLVENVDAAKSEKWEEVVSTLTKFHKKLTHQDNSNNKAMKTTILCKALGFTAKTNRSRLPNVEEQMKSFFDTIMPVSRPARAHRRRKPDEDNDSDPKCPGNCIWVSKEGKRPSSDSGRPAGKNKEKNDYLLQYICISWDKTAAGLCPNLSCHQSEVDAFLTTIPRHLDTLYANLETAATELVEAIKEGYQKHKSKRSKSQSFQNPSVSRSSSGLSLPFIPLNPTIGTDRDGPQPSELPPFKSVCFSYCSFQCLVFSFLTRFMISLYLVETYHFWDNSPWRNPRAGY